ncbi:recombinase family protein, partial [Enterococcus cecorum]|nr:recombinase family protein [Enterococcus cecorum]
MFATTVCPHRLRCQPAPTRFPHFASANAPAADSHPHGNQRELIKSYADKAGFQIIKEYIDDGFTGSNFDRPDFKRMLSDLEKKACKTIIVKDLSRFGRDYIESGKFLQKIFPQMGVRFISVNDNY